MIDNKKIEDNFTRLILIIENGFDGERKNNLLNLYNSNSTRIASAPASNKVYYHSAYIGGYVQHVLNVIDISQRMSKLWKTIQVKETYSDEELLFVAINHDLGKIGDLNEEYYVLTTEDWKIKKGQPFDFSDKLQYMGIPSRSLFLLQSYNIKVSQTEYISILIHDGLYDEMAKSYLINYEPKFALRTMLPHIIHFSDMLAMKKEYEEWKYSDDGVRFFENGEKVSTIRSVNKQKKTKNIFENDDSGFLSSTFNDIFKELEESTKKE